MVKFQIKVPYGEVVPSARRCQQPQSCHHAGDNHSPLHDKDNIQSPSNHNLGIILMTTREPSGWQGGEFPPWGLCPKGMEQAESRAVHAEPHRSRPSSGWRNLRTELRQARLVLERARRVWREDSQRKEVPNSGYICRSFGL